MAPEISVKTENTKMHTISRFHFLAPHITTAAKCMANLTSHSCGDLLPVIC